VREGVEGGLYRDRVREGVENVYTGQSEGCSREMPME